MDLFLYNSLSRKKEKFVPIAPPNVGFYTCGPTVYGPSHIGHTRSYAAFDVLKRALVFNGYKVTHVMNITDVHDSIIKRAYELNVSVEELSTKYTEVLHNDIREMNCIPANFYPKVTENIDGIIEMIKVLIDKGFAYIEKDGSVYYKVSQFKKYGKLSGAQIAQSKAGTRISSDKYEKEEASDFSLWKAAKEGEQSWESPWGRGRPGWHIECSVMAKKLLGDTFDIHVGGMDLKFPHHENEIAQSEVANGKPLARYWVHPGLLDVDGVKMSRSLGNVYSLEDMKKKGFSALDFRYLTFLTHYRSKMNFSWEALEAAQKAYERLVSAMSHFVQKGTTPNRGSPFLSVSFSKYYDRFITAINDDLNMPKALALVWELVKDKGVSDENKTALLEKWDEALGLCLKSNPPAGGSNVKGYEVSSLREVKSKMSKPLMPKEIQELLGKRKALRREKRFEEADALREEIEKLGYKVIDKPH